MDGWIGKILRVDLNKGKSLIEDIDPQRLKDFIGGRGLATKYLFDEIDPVVDPLDSKNKIIFATGPFTGTGVPGGCRYTVVTKSPLTGAIANSNAGGYFPAEIKFAGYDLIIIEGRSKSPVYLRIENEKSEICDAAEVWGKGVKATEDFIHTFANEDAKIATIGPAGEKLVRYANIINDGARAAGRSGVGAVMGSKNLKAVVVKGTKGITIADIGGFKKEILNLLNILKKDPRMLDGFGAYGTPLIVNQINEYGVFPTRNFQTGVFESADKISGETMAKTISRRPLWGKACLSCPIACGRITEVKDPEFRGKGEGPEYETIALLGASCGISNLSAIAKANYICNDLGMDTISTGGTIACAMELFEKGFLPEKDVGMRLNFGNAKALVKLTEMIGKREGFGDLLAEGGYRLCEKYGHPEFFMGTKKQELPGYEPRGLQGLSIHYAVATRGGDHIRGEACLPEIFKIWGDVDPFTTKDKPRIAKEIEDMTTVADCSGICVFVPFLIPRDVAKELVLSFLESATGVKFGGVEGMLRAAERTFNLERLFNLRAGFTEKDDTLPRRMLEEPMPEGPAKGQVSQLGKTLPEYYKLRGWDNKGNLTPEQMKDLGLSSI